MLPERASARAKYLDNYLSKHGKPIGPLHGLPISVKEHIGMKDLGLNAGFVSWWDHKGKDDAHVLKILWSAGCVFYARTTEPQTLMHLETSNNLYGVTTNPFNSQLTSGGSSGGEGALLALRGSCLGLGSDIGGSVRSPAANCGLYSLRPSSYRIPVEGWSATMAGQEQVVAVIGPMSTSLDGIKLIMKTVIRAKPWLNEPSLVPIPWRDEVSYLTGSSDKKRLKVGIMKNDGVVRPHPPIERALHDVVERLQGVEGIEIVEWKPYKHDEAWGIISSLYFSDGGQEEIDAIEASGEPWRPLSNFIIKENPNVKKLSVEEIWYWTKKREAYRSEYARLWNETATGVNDRGDLEARVDVILCPVGPSAAPPLDHAKYWGYTAQWNILDYPALVFPVTKVNPSAEPAFERHDFMSRKDKENFDLWCEKPEVFNGAPVSLQLVGRRYEDEKVSFPCHGWKHDLILTCCSLLKS